MGGPRITDITPLSCARCM